MAGGLRDGQRPGRGRPLTAGDAGGPESPAAPVVAAWEGRIVAVGPRTEVERLVEGEGYPLGRFARLDARGGTVTPGLIDPHTHLLFAGSREDELELRQRGAGYLEILAAGGGILSTVAADPRRDRRGAARPRPALARRDARPRRDDDRGEVRLRARPRRPSCDCSRSPTRSGRTGPIEVVPTFLGAHAVPPEFRGRPDGAEAYVAASSRSSCRASRRRAAPGSATSSASEGVVQRRAVAANPGGRAGARAGARGCMPTSSCHRVARELAAEIGAASADHLAAPSEAGIDALAEPRPPTVDRSSRRCCRRRPGS